MANSRKAKVGPFRAAVLTATLAAGLLLALPAQAFNLGNLTTLSSLGEPLRLEFEVLDLSPAEVPSFRVSLAARQDFTARGLNYGTALEGLRLGLVRSENGRLVIRMEGQRPAADPFVDLLLNMAWASGATTRSVSVLLAPSPGAATAAELPRPPVAPAPALAPTTPAEPAGPALTNNSTSQTDLPARPSIAEPRANPALTGSPVTSTIVVQRGDTAGALAQGEIPEGIEQSQYLLALAQANPRAFVEGNVNRLTAGATLNLPTRAQAAAIPAQEARQVIAAQWQEFQTYRQQISTRPAAAPSSPSAGPQAQGLVDSLASAQAPAPADKLTLSKPSASGAAQAEQVQAQQALLDERQAEEASARLAELARTVGELGQLQANASASSSADPGPAAVLPAAQPAAAPLADSALVDRLADHPAVLPVAGGLLALTLAWLVLRLRRKAAPETDEFDLDLELDLDEQLPRKSETTVPRQTEPSLDALMDLETEHVPAKRANRS